MTVIIENLDQYKKELEEKDKLIIGFFTASWCGPCKRIYPFINKLSSHEKLQEFIKVLKVDVDDCSDVSDYCDIKCMPTFKFYKNNEFKEEITGASEENISELIKKYLSA